MRPIFRFWKPAGAAAAPIDTGKRTESGEGLGADGTREGPRSRQAGRRDRPLPSSSPGFEETLNDYEAFQRLARETPRKSLVAAHETARRAALLDDLAQNDVTFKSFQDFKAWRAELDQA